MTEFIISDTHHLHKNILDFEDRPFENNEQMEAEMITAWNNTVGKNDTVYHLGDFCFGSQKEWARILDQLKGKIILIKGNHDKSKIVERMVRDQLLEEVHPLGTILRRENLFLNMSHYPLLIGNRHRQYSIHGHLHSKVTGEPYHVNVGVDNPYMLKKGRPFGAPLPLDELVEDLKVLEELRIEDTRNIILQETSGN